MLLLPRGNCLADNAYWCPAYFTNHYNRHTILSALSEHVSLVARSVAIALVLSLVIALLVRRSTVARAGSIGVANLLYTIPSVAAFALLSSFLDPRHDTGAVIVLTAYNLILLLRNVLVGLDTVPEDVVEAARGLGYGRFRLVTRVELPLALPSIVAGVRLATVSTIGITTVAALLGFGGLGGLLVAGLNAHPPFHAEIFTALVLCIALAVVSEVVLLLVERWLSPWRRARST
ncbi:MAG TPA: ABC transporter permease [Mycobacteriales bacterium]